MASCFAFAFFLFGLFGILHHELWLDELHHWQLARSSKSVTELFYNMRYEGHPPFWNLILYVITFFTSNSFYMQLVHIVISSLAIFVFFYHAPFTFMFKIGIFFSYFIFFEYHIISRNYALGILFLWILCRLFSSPEKNFLLISLVAGLLAQVHLFFLFLAFAFFLVAFYLNLKGNTTKLKLSVVAFLFMLFCIMVLNFIIPPENHFLTHYNNEKYFSFARLEKGSSVFIKAFLHIPDFTITTSWNSNYLLNNFKWLFILPAILYFFVPFIIFYRSKICLFLFYFSSGAVVLFLYSSPLATGIRYYGIIWLSFISTLWIYKLPLIYPKITYSNSMEKYLFRIEAYVKKPFFVLLFSTQIAASAIMFAKDYLHPFSQAKNVGDFISKQGFKRHHYAVSNIASVSSLATFLPEKPFSLEAEKFCDFSPWEVYPFQYKSSEIQNCFMDLFRSDSLNWMLVSNHYLDFTALTPLYINHGILTIKPIKYFTGSLVSTENYYLYEVTVKQVFPKK